ncbi:unnamed protein product [Schistocephalus solidus]|uniref:Pentatricopeptide repeat-containing protein n=1 Tax=Schistocephalus solidus TaxID=70667 RepID=A0A183SYF9_SCHSO|nr:unnamed protein product [Schistocephalus solidus]
MVSKRSNNSSEFEELIMISSRNAAAPSSPVSMVSMVCWKIQEAGSPLELVNDLSIEPRLASPTLDNLETFLRFCNPDDGLQVQLMIKAGFDGFASLIGGLCSQQGRISVMIS